LEKREGSMAAPAWPHGAPDCLRFVRMRASRFGNAQGTTMTLRNLGKSGLRVSLVGLGCNNFGQRMDLESSTKVIHKALDAGITLFDTADVYGGRGGSETVLGQVLGDRRKDIVLASKFGMAMDDGERKGGSRRYIMSALDASLKRLKTDWLDLYQIHRHDPLTPIEETLRTLDDIVRAGKVRYIGCSNFTAAQMVEAQLTARHLNLNAFISAQDEYSLLKRTLDRENLPMMERYGLGLLPYFPLASGLLTGKHKRGAAASGTRLATQTFAGMFMTDANFDIVEKLEAFVQARGHTMLELAMGWLASKPYIPSVIAGATSPEQVRQNAEAIGWRLSPDEMAAADAIAA